MNLKASVTLCAAALTLVLPASAAAHVTLQPDTAPAGDYVVFEVRVPNERDDAGTTKVDVQFPPGFASASYQPVEGWSAQVQMVNLDEPLTSHGEQVTEGVGRITWTADSDADAIQAGQFQDFPISVQVPGEAGETLTFKALQTYENGEVVRWIGAPDSDDPAPQVTVTEGAEHGADDSSEESDDSAGASKGLGIAALLAGLLGLLAGGTALVRSRRVS